MTEEQHLWACALQVQEQHGDRAAIHVAESIGALALAGDSGGVDRWTSIAACLNSLQARAGKMHRAN
jgi:hypothetical protein